jgi:hypothetical protein
MKFLTKLLVLFVSMSCVQGCNYGEETLKVVHPETISLIEQPNKSASKKILEANKKKGWFFIPQAIFRPHEDKAWLAVRVYSRSSELNYEISRTEVSFPQGSTIEAVNIKPGKPNWYPTENDWFYQVVKVKSYSYSSLASSGVRSASVAFELTVNGDVRSEEFDLEVKKVRRSGW